MTPELEALGALVTGVLLAPVFVVASFNYFKGLWTP